MRVLTLLITLLFALGCGDLKVIDEQGTAEVEELPITMEGMQYAEYADDGRPERIIHAERADLFQERQCATMVNLRMEFYEGDRMISLLEADTGTADWIKEEFTAVGERNNIRVTREDGNQIVYAQSFIYHPEEDLLFTEDPFTMVQISENGTALITSGREMYTTPDLTQIDIRGRYSLDTIADFDANAFDREHHPLTQE